MSKYKDMAREMKSRYNVRLAAELTKKKKYRRRWMEEVIQNRPPEVGGKADDDGAVLGPRVGGAAIGALNTAGLVRDNSAVDPSTPDNTAIVAVTRTKEKVPIGSNDSVDYDDDDDKDDNPIATISPR